MPNKIQLSHAEYPKFGGPSPLLYHPPLLQTSKHLAHHCDFTMFNHLGLKSDADTGITDTHPYYTYEYECAYKHRQTDIHTHEHTY